MSDVTDILDQLNRDLAALQHTHRRNAEEAYPGHPGELPRLPADEYDERMATCVRQSAIAIGIDLARKLVLKARDEAAQEATA